MVNIVFTSVSLNDTEDKLTIDFTAAGIVKQRIFRYPLDARMVKSLVNREFNPPSELQALTKVEKENILKLELGIM